MADAMIQQLLVFTDVARLNWPFARIRDDGRHASKRLLPQQDLANANEAGRGRPNRTKLARSLSKQQQRTLWIGSARNQNAVKNPGGRNTLNQMGHAPQPPGGKQSGVRKVNTGNVPFPLVSTGAPSRPFRGANPNYQQGALIASTERDLLVCLP
ncbi:hypothetical protein CpipJ_CPIJ010624 [Culex quinquefasciatus]|uniref:Uncharacterized protein n=1 Tax=Culex quinquefasciatus TaxID=7176 RepID=B0WV13_CULQU|nr:hypothetical protein CpipJ_CPIJ010624 [Culex quinquefasciatus]|eukprot:XP_001870997.1 hypothetical protein CpipJ_CPIJ010624 [Culex quinquefasciatus]